MDLNWKPVVDQLLAIEARGRGDGEAQFAAHVRGLFESDHPHAAVAALVDAIFHGEVPEGVHPSERETDPEVTVDEPFADVVPPEG